MQMPDICARCGKVESAALWEIKHSTIKYDSDFGPILLILSLLLLLTGDHICSGRREHYRIPVPVCEACLRVLRVHRIFSIVLKLTSLIGAGLASGLYCYKLEPNNEYFGPFVWIVVGLLGCLGGWCAGAVVAEILGFFLRANMVSFDGLYFRFRNKGFHRQFALLNPNWVKP